MIFAYLGPGEPSLLPAYEILTVPAENRFIRKAFSECNYLQGNEGNIDPVHLSFLHVVLDENLAKTGRPAEFVNVRGSQNSVNRPRTWSSFLNLFPSPPIGKTTHGKLKWN